MVAFGKCCLLQPPGEGWGVPPASSSVPSSLLRPSPFKKNVSDRIHRSTLMIAKCTVDRSVHVPVPPLTLRLQVQPMTGFERGSFRQFCRRGDNGSPADLICGLYAGCGKAISRVSLMPSVGSQPNEAASPSAPRASASIPTANAPSPPATGHSQSRRFSNRRTTCETHHEHRDYG